MIRKYQIKNQKKLIIINRFINNSPVSKKETELLIPDPVQSGTSTTKVYTNIERSGRTYN